MSSASIQQQIKALGRGELDVSTLIGQIRDILSNTSSAADGLLEELEAAHRDDTITTRDYTRLAQFIFESSSDDDPKDVQQTLGEIGDTVLVDPADAAAEQVDDSQTRYFEPSPADPDDPDPSSDSGPAGQIDLGMRLRDRFILDEILGVGGMGTVYKGRDALKLEAQDRNPFVAVKILNDRFKQHPEAFVALQREASRQQRLAHPNIATVYDFDRDKGVMFITMEFLDGKTLDQVIREQVKPQGGWTLAEAMPIIQDLCAALSHAHDRNIVHADFKPGNCFITQSNHVKVLDFGIARAVKDPNAAAGDETLFDPRSIGALTPAYASPEMLLASEEPDPRDDIYALACVVYELLTGKHPYLRVPGDQAKQNGLVPKRIKKLSRKQNDALLKALAFERSDRTPTVAEFLADLKQESNRPPLLWMLGAVAAISIVVITLITVSSYLATQQIDEVVSDLSSAEPQRVADGITSLEALDPELKARALVESRGALIEFISSEYELGVDAADADIAYTELETLLDTGLELYPDSLALNGLKGDFDIRKQTYLAALAGLFEEYLVADRLLDNPADDDLLDLLGRIEAVDPANTLLTDDRIAAAYVAAVESALGTEQYSEARQFLETGLVFAPEDLGLSDLQDRLDVIEQQLELASTIARLESEFSATVESVENLEDLPALVAAAESLWLADSDNELPSAAGATIVERLSPALEAVYASDDLPTLRDFMSSYGQAFALLGQQQPISAVAAREQALIDRQSELVSQIQALLATPQMAMSDGTGILELIDELEIIEPTDPRISDLLAAIGQERLNRSRAHLAAERWQDARAELALAAPLPLSDELSGAIAREAERIDTAESAAAERLLEEQRLAAAQEAQARREIEAQQQAAEQERQRLAALARQNEIDAAVSLLNDSLLKFDTANPQASVRQAQLRIASLSSLAANHPELARAEAELARLSAASVRFETNPSRALNLLAELSELVGTNPELEKLRLDLLEAQQSEMARDRQLAIVNAGEAVTAALRNANDLQSSETRRTIESAIRELEELAGAEASIVQSAKSDYVTGLLETAEGLIESKRFSLAGALLDTAVAQQGNSPAVSEVRQRAERAQATYRTQRAEQQQTARLVALRQRFQLEVDSDQLDRAAETLAEHTRLDASDGFFQTDATAKLAAAYANRAQDAIEARQFDQARQALAAGKGYAVDPGRIEQIQMELEVAELNHSLDSWFAGESSEPLNRISTQIERFSNLAAERFETASDNWVRTVTTRLNQLESDPVAYNALLAEATQLLPGNRQLTSLVPLSSGLELADLLGQWCDKDTTLRFTPSNMEFDLGSQTVNYKVNGYDVDDKLIRVAWQQSRNQALEFEFGRFSDSKTEMTQIRGREAGKNNWQTYNRVFRRCP